MQQEYPEECQQWDEFWLSLSKEPTSQLHLVDPFTIPRKQQQNNNLAGKKRVAAKIDDGVRAIDVVTQKKFRHTDRLRAEHQLHSEGLDTTTLDALHKGDVLLIDFLPTNNPAYKLPFMIAEIEQDVSVIDTTTTDTEIPVQILRPTDMQSFHKKIIRWQGDDNQFWRPHVARGSLKAIVHLTSKGKKLNSTSISLIKPQNNGLL